MNEIAEMFNSGRNAVTIDQPVYKTVKPRQEFCSPLTRSIARLMGNENPTPISFIDRYEKVTLRRLLPTAEQRKEIKRREREQRKQFRQHR